jgi:hypothetical protein
MNRQVDDRNLHTLPRTWSATRRALPAFAVLIAVLLVALPAHAQSSSNGPSLVYSGVDFSAIHVCGMGQSSIARISIPFTGSSFLHTSATLSIHYADSNNYCPSTPINYMLRSEPAGALNATQVLYYLNNNTWQVCQYLPLFSNTTSNNTVTALSLLSARPCGSGWYGVYSNLYLNYSDYGGWLWSGAIYVP